jgi:hypothetical protein
MTNETTQPVRVLGPDDGDVLPSLGGVRNRFMIDGKETGGRFALVQHLFEPRAFAAPMHRHRDEDEYARGPDRRRAGRRRGRRRPRGDEPASALEIISTAGLEELFREFGRMTSAPEPDVLSQMTARIGCDLDFEATAGVVQRHSLLF